MLLELEWVWRTRKKAEKSSRWKCVPRRERVLHEERESTEGSQTQTLGLRMSRVKVVGRQLRGCGPAWSCGGQVGEWNDMIGVA